MNRYSLRIRAAAMGVLVSVALIAGCYHYVAKVSEAAGPPATEYTGEVVWSLAWGLVQQNPQIGNCQDQPLAEVRVSSNFGFVLLTIATLGIAAPAKVEWRCAKAKPAPGVIRPPRDSVPPR